MINVNPLTWWYAMCDSYLRWRCRRTGHPAITRDWQYRGLPPMWSPSEEMRCLRCRQIVTDVEGNYYGWDRPVFTEVTMRSMREITRLGGVVSVQCSDTTRLVPQPLGEVSVSEDTFPERPDE